MTITLYDCSTAPSPRRARILLAEKGVAFETVQVDLRNGEQLSDAYRLVNPLCTVPALRTDEGMLLADNAAITAYIEARFPQPALLGETPAEKAEIASWNWRVEFEGLLAIAEALRNSAPAMANRALPGPVDYPQIPELAQRGLSRVQQFFAVLNERLAGREFIAAERFSIADNHRRGGRRLRTGRQGQARRTAPAPAALARRHGAAPGDVALSGRQSVAARRASWSVATPQPSWKPIFSWAAQSSAFQCLARAV